MPNPAVILIYMLDNTTGELIKKKEYRCNIFCFKIKTLHFFSKVNESSKIKFKKMFLVLSFCMYTSKSLTPSSYDFTSYLAKCKYGERNIRTKILIWLSQLSYCRQIAGLPTIFAKANHDAALYLCICVRYLIMFLHMFRVYDMNISC